MTISANNDLNGNLLAPTVPEQTTNGCLSTCCKSLLATISTCFSCCQTAQQPWTRPRPLNLEAGEDTAQVQRMQNHIYRANNQWNKPQDRMKEAEINILPKKNFFQLPKTASEKEIYRGIDGHLRIFNQATNQTKLLRVGKVYQSNAHKFRLESDGNLYRQQENGDWYCRGGNKMTYCIASSGIRYVKTTNGPWHQVIQ